ncbi:hypothetical protein D039_3554A, partial [Vibrio parahaemolyticus EKP-028]
MLGRPYPEAHGDDPRLRDGQNLGTTQWLSLKQS